MTTRPPIAAALSLVLCASSAFAERHGRFRESDVVPGALWYLHVNMDELKSAQVGRDLRSRLDAKAMASIRVLERIVSFNPLEDLDAVTVSGRAVEPENAVAVVRGVFDRQHLTDLAVIAKGYRAEEFSGQTIHSWTDAKAGGRVFAALPEGDTVFIGPDQDLVKAALKRNLDGDKDSETAPGARPPIVTAWADLSLLEGLEIESAFVRRVRKVHISAGEQAGKLVGEVIVETGDDKTARLLGRMFSGAVALAEAAEQIPDGTSDLVRTKASGRTLTIGLEIALDSFGDLVNSIVEIQRGL